MKKNKQIGFIILLLLLIYDNSSLACNCIGKDKTKQALKKSDYVFKGKVIEKHIFVIDTLFANRYVYNIRYTFEVEIIYKGRKKNHKRKISVITGVGSGDCGFEFENGKQYIVYSGWKDRFLNKGDKADKFLYTNICTRTTSEISKEEDAIKKVRGPCRWRVFQSQ